MRSPCTNSMAIHARSSSTPASISRATAGCSRRASNWDSRAKRNWPRAAMARDTSLTATDCRTPSMRSARYTTPMPPSPMRSIRRKRPTARPARSSTAGPRSGTSELVAMLSRPAISSSASTWARSAGSASHSPSRKRARSAAARSKALENIRYASARVAGSALSIVSIVLLAKTWCGLRPSVARWASPTAGSRRA